MHIRNKKNRSQKLDNCYYAHSFYYVFSFFCTHEKKKRLFTEEKERFTKQESYPPRKTKEKWKLEIQENTESSKDF